MILRNSLWSILRTKGKTALFTLLIFALTLALALGVCVWASVSQFLEDCTEFYSTIGIVEYMGSDYPDDIANDAGMVKALESFNSSLISNDIATIKWNEPNRSFGYIDGFWRTDKYVPARMNSVFVIGNVTYVERDHRYSALVKDVFYSLKSRENTLIYIDEDFGTFEEDHYYLVFGEVYNSRSPLLRLRTAEFDNAIVEGLGIEIPRFEDITTDGTNGQNYLVPEDSVLMQVANTLKVSKNSLLVSSIEDLMSIPSFHQEELYIIRGRAFSDDEYLNRARVIIISDLVAARLGVGVGDTIDLSIAVSDYPGVYNSYWAGNEFSYTATFEVVGITNTVTDKSWYVYIPKSAETPSSSFPIGYTVGYATVLNDEAASFFSRIDPLLGDRLQLTIYDQGYSSVAIPFKTILVVAKIITTVCGLVVLAVLILFGFIFVYRQRETSETMLFLGSGRLRVCVYFLFSSGLIALIASAAGSVTGFLLHDSITALVAKAAENYALIDSRYSNGNLTISRTLEFAPDLDWQLFFFVGISVFALTLLSCLAFVISTFINRRPSQRKLRGPKKERKTSRFGGGSLKYSFLSIFHGGARSMVVPILAIAVVFFFGQLALTTLSYQEQLDTIYNNTIIKGNYTDIEGKQIGNLILNAYDVFGLYQTGYISDLSVSISEPYYYRGTSILADGTYLNISPLFVPRNGFVRESMEDMILRGPDLTATNNIQTSPEFYYADNVIMQFLDGYDESFLAERNSNSSSINCLVPTSLMIDQGISLGDTIRVVINNKVWSPEDLESIFRHYDLLVVGNYEKQGAEDTIYVPLSLVFDTSLIWDIDQATGDSPTEVFDNGLTINDSQKDLLQSITLHSSTFNIPEARSLGEVKDYLKTYGYSQVHKVSKVREFIVLRDAAFNNTIASIKQQIRYIDTLYPFLYALVGIIAIVVSYLIVISRKLEFATMRGLGTTRISTFFSFFFEQSILCVLGSVLGLIFWLLILGPPSTLHIILSTGFFICYLLGSALSVTILSQSNVLTILTDRD